MGVLDGAGLAALDARARQVVDAAAAALTETPQGANAPRIRPGLLPAAAAVDEGIRFPPPRVAEAAVPAEPRREVKFIDIVAPTLMRRWSATRRS
jgi:2-oxoisovalerate dehydrogenase E1 component